MQLHSYRVKNFRRLKDVYIDLEKDVSIFVGANNSGKTSATHALQMFINGSTKSFSLYDFTLDCWDTFDEIGKLSIQYNKGDTYERLQYDLNKKFPRITLDLWFNVEESDLSLVDELFGTADHKETKVGIRVAFMLRNSLDLLTIYHDANSKAKKTAEGSNTKYKPWPRSLTEFLVKELSNHYELRYFILDRAQFDEKFNEKDPDYIPDNFSRYKGDGASFLKLLIHVDCLNAQSGLSDYNLESVNNSSADLFNPLSKIYNRNVKRYQHEQGPLKHLFYAEQMLDNHLKDIFSNLPIASEGADNLGGNNPNPSLKIKAEINTDLLMRDHARVYYQLYNDNSKFLWPYSYEGLGKKKFLEMSISIEDAQLKLSEMSRIPKLHLIIIEEPEAHLHVQLQQTFIRTIESRLNKFPGIRKLVHIHVIITTHSPHILYENGFKPIRYFRRQEKDDRQTTEVLNLSNFYHNKAKAEDRDFLERYLKLTHCDLFFTDATIFVEGDAERLLLPAMIKNLETKEELEKLTSACISILEVGGAYAHRFFDLIEFLGVPSLIITDLDSVNGHPARVCYVSDKGAVASNPILNNWPPKNNKLLAKRKSSSSVKRKEITELLSWEDDKKIHSFNSGAKVIIAYQIPREVEWNGKSEKLCGRTFEDDFALENPEWCQRTENIKIPRSLKESATLLVRKASSPSSLAKNLHNALNPPTPKGAKRKPKSNVDKKNFALTILTADKSIWEVPYYIKDGLKKLEAELSSKKVNKLPKFSDKELLECIEQKQSFILTAGAGSGKTTSFIKAINSAINLYGEQFKREGKQIACITYTSVAAEEIWQDLRRDTLVHVSTIHSFLWILIQPLQNDIRKWLLANIKVKITALEAHNQETRTRDETKQKNEDKISRLKNDMEDVGTVRSFIYSSTGSNYKEGMLGHDDVIKLGIYFIKENHIFRKLVAEKFPFIFVDEYQDTKPDIVDGLISITEETKEFCLGFFGDPMQQIYTDGVGEIKDKKLKEIIKTENFRSSQNVVALANNIRKEVDGIQQTKCYNRELGQVHLFILPADDNRDKNINKVRTFMANISKDLEWNFAKNEHEKVKILMLIHRSAAKSLGFPNLYSALNDNAPREFKTMVQEAEGWVVDPFLKKLLPLYLAYSEGRNYEFMNLLSEFSPALALAKATNGTEKAEKTTSGAELAQTLNQIKEAMNEFSFMISAYSNLTIRDLCYFAQEKKLLNLNLKFTEHLYNTEHLYSEEDIRKEKDEKRKNEIMVYNAMQAFLNSPAKELLPYYNYKLKESPFSTQMGVKGAEFDRVLVVLDDEESKYNLFSYENYFGLEELSYIYEAYKKAGKETIVDRTRRLFYLACTRAKKDLAVVLFTSKVNHPENQDKIKQKIVERNLFELDNIHTVDDLDKALEKQAALVVEPS